MTTFGLVNFDGHAQPTDPLAAPSFFDDTKTNFTAKSKPVLDRFTTSTFTFVD